jgi:hypothetical protein
MRRGRDPLVGAVRTGDPAADAAVAALGSSRAIWGANVLLAGSRRNADPLPRTLPRPVRELFAAGAELPPFVDRDAIARAQAWAQRHRVRIVVALFCAALPTAYAAARGAEVLVATGRMRGDLDQRVVETGRFVLDVLAPGGFAPDGAAVRSAQKVRLVHAAVRHHLRKHGTPRGRVPINQLELLGTLFCFSLTTCDAVARLGADVTEREAEDYYKLWRTVGWLMGIEPERLPARLAEARRLSARIAARELRPSPAGRELLRALVTAMEDHMPVPLLRPIPSALVRVLVDPNVADMFGGPRATATASSWATALLGAGAAVSRRGGRALDAALVPIGSALIDLLMASKLRGRPSPRFEMPSSLPTPRGACPYHAHEEKV